MYVKNPLKKKFKRRAHDSTIPVSCGYFYVVVFCTTPTQLIVHLCLIEGGSYLVLFMNGSKI